ncbi:hypothetical protein Fmac_022399 [Flemingia macrophylla]|uniref:Uncharacterized protein n=1 Tax=Flemingia macrophylla TaxID=520843 RepID=A0ABD1LZL3_9FABA
MNRFEKVDAVLQSLIIQRPSSLENFHSHMENLELCIQDLEIGLDHLSRKLIRNRDYWAKLSIPRNHGNQQHLPILPDPTIHHQPS